MRDGAYLPRVRPGLSVARSTPHSATVSCQRRNRARGGGARHGGGETDTAGEGAVAFVNGSAVVIVSLLQFLLQKFISKERVPFLSLSFFMNFFSRLSVPDFLLEWTLSGRSEATEQTRRLPGDSPANVPVT